MAKVEIILKKWQTLKNGTHPIVLRVAKKGDRRLFVTGLTCLPKQWNDEYGLFINDKRLVKDYESLNIILANVRIKAENVISEFDRMGIDWTLTQFETNFLSQSIRLSPAQYFEQHIESLMAEKKFGYAEVNQSTLHILRIFDKKFDKLKFPDIDPDYIRRFDSFLRNERGLKDTSISIYMRTFSTLLNSAIADGMMLSGSYPFKTKQNEGYRISKLNVQTKKRFIPTVYLKSLKDFQFTDSRLAIARNLFLFSFYCRGINWIDMAMLTTNNLVKDISETGELITVIKYTRAKTHKDFQIVINEEIQTLLDWFKTVHRNEPYLLPIITRPNHSGEALRQHISDRRGKYNKALNDIVKMEELNFPDALKHITSYFSRHSYAMALRQKGENIELIQEALGHSELPTTRIYLDSFGREAVAKASANLL